MERVRVTWLQALFALVLLLQNESQHLIGYQRCQICRT